MHSNVKEVIANFEAAIAAQDTPPPPKSQQCACASRQTSATPATCVCAGRQMPTVTGQLTAGVTPDLSPHMRHLTASVCRGNTFPATPATSFQATSFQASKRRHSSDSSSLWTMSPGSPSALSPKGKGPGKGKKSKPDPNPNNNGEGEVKYPSRDWRFKYRIPKLDQGEIDESSDLSSIPPKGGEPCGNPPVHEQRSNDLAQSPGS